MFRSAALSLAMLALAPAAHAALPQQSGELDLLTQSQGRVDGSTAGDVSGEAVSGAGDVNKDGVGDILIGSGGKNGAVVFGSSPFGDLDALSLGARGFRIVGNALHTVASAGDQNADGFADVVVAESTTNKAFVIFGKANGDPVVLGALGTAGYSITGFTGTPTVGTAPDMNGDGFREILVGDPNASFSARASSGVTYVVFGGGHAAGSTFAASTVGAATPGFVVGGAQNDSSGAQVAGAGDVDGDGKGDLLVAAPGASNNGRSFSGSVYVVRGKGTTTQIDLTTAGATRIDGEKQDDGLGRSVAMAGDANGDGFGDVVVGASNADHDPAENAGIQTTGSAYVVFGSASPPATIDLLTLATGDKGYRIDGAEHQEEAARSLGGGSDVNGDGRSDVVLGALFADAQGRSQAGALYVVYGKATSTTVSVASLGAQGFKVYAPLAGDSLGRGAALPGDVTGDGRPDVIGGAEFADLNGRNQSGSVYVALGFGTPSFSLPAGRTVTTGTAIEPLSPTDVKRTGIAEWTVSPLLPDGITLDAAFGTVSGTPTAAQPSTTYTLTMTDLAGTATQNFTLQVDAPAVVTPPVIDDLPPTVAKPCTLTRRGNGKNNVLLGNARSNRIFGGRGNDRIEGRSGRDCLFGEAGDDRISGGKGADRISGGPGRDRVDSKDGVRDTVNCGPGADRVRADARDKLRGCERRVKKL